MRKIWWVAVFAILLTMPTYATSAQTPDRIILQDNFGQYDRGERIFLFGSIAQITPGAYLILQVINPDGDICQIQQLTPLSDGMFLTEQIPLQGRICGSSGEYSVKVFYGDYMANAKFTISTDIYSGPTEQTYLERANELLSQKIDSVDGKTNADLSPYTIRAFGAVGSLSEMEAIYSDLWVDFVIDDELYELNPEFRPAIESALKATLNLITSEKLSFDAARDIDRHTFAAAFYYEIGDKRSAIARLNDAFSSIKNADPVKIESSRSLSYAELEATVNELMVKTGSILSSEVKTELAFISARGTAPVYVDELTALVDMLTKARYLDVITRKDSSLYRLIQTEWSSARTSLASERSVAEIIESKDRIANLHEASLLLRDLDDVSRYVDKNRDNNSELINIILPSWNRLVLNLELATSTTDIFDARQDIADMKNVVDISSRISNVVEISGDGSLDNGIVGGWEELLVRVDDANSIPEILIIVTEFNDSIHELREKRSPLGLLKFEYSTLKAKAEIQGDDANLIMINDALRIIDTAQKIEAGSPTVNKIDRIEVLLVWVSESLPDIRDDLNSYTKDAYKVRASDILQRTKSIENLVDAGLTTKRFLPGFVDFADSVDKKIEQIRATVTSGELDRADGMVRDLFDEWQTVNEAYARDPFGGKKGYSLDELKKIEFRERLETLKDAVNNFYNNDFDEHSDEYILLVDDAYAMIDRGNFVDAESKIDEIGRFVGENLALMHDRIIYDISYDQKNSIWIISGYLDKTIDWRQKLHLTVYDKDAEVHSKLEFTDTKQGQFLTRWHAPTDPGIYIVLLQWENAEASQIIYIPKVVEYDYTAEDLSTVELAREYEELESFIEAFGGDYQDRGEKIIHIMADIDEALTDGDTNTARQKIAELQGLIERYLPERSRNAVIDAKYDDGNLVISGAVKKELAFSEDLYVDIFNQKGDRVNEIYLKDSATGHFDESVAISLGPGTYVAQLSHHDAIVTDYFVVRG